MQSGIVLRTLAIVCFLGFGVVACADFTVDELLDDVETLASPLEESDDPKVRAAAQANAEIAREREARESLERALETRDPYALDEAMRLRPNDPTYPYHKMALLAASGEQGLADEIEELNARGIAAFKANGSDQFERSAYMLNAYANVRDSFPADSAEWQRVNELYCLAYNISVHAQREDPVETFLTVGTYSDESCK